MLLYDIISILKVKKLVMGMPWIPEHVAFDLQWGGGDDVLRSSVLYCYVAHMTQNNTTYSL